MYLWSAVDVEQDRVLGSVLEVVRPEYHRVHNVTRVYLVREQFWVVDICFRH